MGPNGTLADEKEVLHACLAKIGSGSQQVVMGATGLNMARSHVTDGGESLIAFAASQLPEISRDTAADFVMKNCKRHPISSQLVSSDRATILSASELNRIFRKRRDGWDRFCELHPKSAGYIQLSRVGFNESRTQALVYLGRQAHWTAGRGAIYALKKRGKGWIQTGNVMVWIS